VKRFLSLLLLPLSVIPFVGLAPQIVNSHQRFEREHNMDALPAPRVSLTGAERLRFAQFPAPAKEVPVLVWHGIVPANDGYSTSQRAFARQLALLKSLGYTAISTRQWADFRSGVIGGLPDKPILLTFDDGRLDSYRGADAVLKQMRMRAAMFVITGEIEKKSPFYLTWAELHKMRSSGRWDIEPHAHEGHQEVAISSDETSAPFYAARRFTRSEGLESLRLWEARVSGDLFAVRERFAAQGIEPQTFAVPFGDYGQRGANDAAIPTLLSGLLTRQFGSFFIQADDDDPGFTVPGTGAAERYELRTGTSLDALYGWLSRHSKTDETRN
jgi:poly-beta-1,6-N-acetyl-D-glucosamine N-deacetylase